MASPRQIRAGAAYVELNARDKFSSALKRLGRTFAKSVKAIAVGIGAIGSITAAGLGLALKHFTSFGSELADMSKRTGMSVEALSEFKYAAEQTGGSLESVETAVKRMQKTIADAAKGEKEATDALTNLGLSYEDLKDLRPEDQFKLIAKHVAAIPDPTARAAAAMEVFGRSGTDLLPMISDLQSLTNRARELGLVMTTEAAAAADDLGDKFDDLKAVTGAAGREIAGHLAPVVTRIIDAMVGAAKAATDWARSNRALFKSLAAGEFRAAGEIAALNFRIAFEELKDYLGGVFDDIKNSLVKNFEDGLLAAANLLEKAKKWFAESEAGFQVQMKLEGNKERSARSGIAFHEDRIRRGLSTNTFDFETQKKALQESLAEQSRLIEERNKAMRAEMKAQEQRPSNVAAMRDRLRQMTTPVPGGVPSRGALMEQLPDAAATAADALETVAGAAHDFFNEFAGAADLNDAAASVAAAADKAMGATSRGTFGSQNIAQVLGPDYVDVGKRQVAIAEKQERHLSDLVKAARRGLILGP